jgi:predicted MPP superfamily phosphohydrolase
MGCWIFLGPLLYYWLFQQINPLKSVPKTTPLAIAHALYIGVSFGAACIVLPIVTVARLLRRLPKRVIKHETEVLDIEAKLGYKPVGNGKYRKFAQLPGNNHFNVDITTLTISFDNIPAEWDGLTTLHLTDMHFYGTPGLDYFEAILAKCEEFGQPDLLLITGDIIDTNDHIAWMEPVLGRIKPKEGAFSILGNHDWWQDSEAVRAKLRELNITSLGNGWEIAKVKGKPMTIIGHEGPWFRPGPELFAAPTGHFRLLLSHTPDYIEWASRNKVDLMLSGHNHGGQIRLPIFGSIFVPSRHGRRYDTGTFERKGTILHVNRGMSSKEPIRFRCNPQVTRIVFRKG